MHAAEVASGRRRRRRPHHEHHRRQRRRQLRVAGAGQRLGHRRRRLQDQRVGGHQATDRIGLEHHQAAQRPRLLGVHQLQQHVGAAFVEFAQQVGGVVGVHLLEDVRGALDGEVLQDFRLVVVGKLLDDVGQQFIVEGLGDAAAAFRRHFGHGHGDVGGAHFVELRDQLRVVVAGLRAGAEAVDVIPRRHGNGPPPAQPALGPQHRHAGEDPIAGARPLHLHVGELLRHAVQVLQIGVVDLHLRTDQVAEHGRLAGPGLELAHGHQAGVEQDLVGLDGGDAPHRHEDAAFVGQLQDQPQRPRRRAGRPQPHDHVAGAADGVAVGVAHDHPRQTSRVYAVDGSHDYEDNRCSGSLFPFAPA
ncbi:Uncharacterised protein [Clostridium paraputrificum]|nr:Uncharacterised protein [Clostridium paraputrificum]